MKTRLSLAAAVRFYLQSRRQLGFALKSEHWALPSLARYVCRLGHHGPLTCSLALKWSAQTDHQPQRACRLNMVRRFARFWQAFDLATEIPSPGVFGPGFRRRPVHVYTAQEISALLRATTLLGSPQELRAASLRTVLSLLACIGLRASELVGLRCQDVVLALNFRIALSARFPQSTPMLARVCSAFVNSIEACPVRPDRHGGVRRSRPIPGSQVLKPVLRLVGPSLLGLFVLVGSGCKSMHSHINRPLQEGSLAPDCRATCEITQPRGEEDVLVILCFSGGGSRAAWFSAATMLRLERVVGEVNLLHEVDVISSVSGGGLPAAYYCLSRDPGPYSVVRVQQFPESLPSELAKVVRMDRPHGLLGFHGKMSAQQRDLLRPLFVGPDQGRVDRLFWLSHHTHAPEIWGPEMVRELMTRNYISKLLWDVCVPRWHYWFTSYDRSDMMSKIFVRNLYGNRLVEIPKPLKQTPDLECLGCLDRYPAAGAEKDNPESDAGDEQVLRWPKGQPSRVPVRLDWISGYSPAQKTAQVVPVDGVTDDVERIPMRPSPRVPYRFKDLNPERPYLIINATDGTEDQTGEPHFGQVFAFTREEFKQHVNSNVDTYEVAHAVMASAAFPGVFSFVTLRDFRPEAAKDRPRYMHLFDGGNADNLGLESAKKIILANQDRYRHFVVMLVDSHVPPTGASRYKPDVRNRIVDYNFMTSFGTLLDTVRSRQLEEFNSGTLNGHALKNKLIFWHLSFDQVRDEPTRSKANEIPTTFKISRENAEVIDQCVADLIRPDHPKLQEILRVLRVSEKGGQSSQSRRD